MLTNVYVDCLVYKTDRLQLVACKCIPNVMFICELHLHCLYGSGFPFTVLSVIVVYNLHHTWDNTLCNHKLLF